MRETFSAAVSLAVVQVASAGPGLHAPVKLQSLPLLPLASLAAVVGRQRAPLGEQEAPPHRVLRMHLARQAPRAAAEARLGDARQLKRARKRDHDLSGRRQRRHR